MSARNFIRSLIAQSVGKSEPEAYAKARWGDYEGNHIGKAAVLSVLSSELSHDASEFFDAVRANAIIGKLTGLREIPFFVRMLAATNGAQGYWTSQGSSKPLSKPVIEGSQLLPLKLAALIVTTQESLKTCGNLVEAALQRDIQNALVELLDESFIDRNNAGVAGQTPASITYGVTPVATNGVDALSLSQMISSFTGNLLSSYFITDAVSAATLAMQGDSSDRMFPDLGVRCGQILGIPVIVSNTSTVDSNGGQLVLVDPTQIALGMDLVRTEVSGQASLMMVDDPSAPAEEVSLFQTNSVAMLAEIEANWSVKNPGSVQLITGI